MITFLLASLVVISLATAFIALMCILTACEYDDWVKEFEAKGGVQLPCPIFNAGGDHVGYTEIVERRQRER